MRSENFIVAILVGLSVSACTQVKAPTAPPRDVILAERAVQRAAEPLPMDAGDRAEVISEKTKADVGAIAEQDVTVLAYLSSGAALQRQGDCIVYRVDTGDRGSRFVTVCSQNGTVAVAMTE